jgi:hypothetical protein
VNRKDIIQAKALEIIANAPKGVRYSELMRQIQEAYPDIPHNTITGSVWNLDAILPLQVYKPERGIFRHIKYKEQVQVTTEKSITSTPARRVKEEDFYASFADWIKNELEECTKAIPLGGNVFRDKWGTPDVIGIRAARASDIIKFSTEIVSAEVKIDSNDLITAFGQACSYKLFSHKSYMVVPEQSSVEDVARLDALCRIFGIGLIMFDNTKPENPDYQIRVRASKHEPDMFFLNKYLKIKTIEDKLFT